MRTKHTRISRHNHRPTTPACCEETWGSQGTPWELVPTSRAQSCLYTVFAVHVELHIMDMQALDKCRMLSLHVPLSSQHTNKRAPAMNDSPSGSAHALEACSQHLSKSTRRFAASSRQSLRQYAGVCACVVVCVYVFVCAGVRGICVCPRRRTRPEHASLDGSRKRCTGTASLPGGGKDLCVKPFFCGTTCRF